MLEREYKTKQLRLPKGMRGISDLKRKVYEKEWNVYLKKPMAGPKAVVRYLGRYTHRVAISNNRLVSMDEGSVTFHWKDYRKKMPTKQLLALRADEFISRFMRKIRYYGLLAPVNKAKRGKCYALINKPLHTALFSGVVYQ